MNSKFQSELQCNFLMLEDFFGTPRTFAYWTKTATFLYNWPPKYRLFRSYGSLKIFLSREQIFCATQDDGQSSAYHDDVLMTLLCITI